jgi:hypothetical protein
MTLDAVADLRGTTDHPPIPMLRERPRLEKSISSWHSEIRLSSASCLFMRLISRSSLRSARQVTSSRVAGTLSRSNTPFGDEPVGKSGPLARARP